MYSLICAVVCGVILMMASAIFRKQHQGMGTLAAVLLIILTGVNAWEAWEISNSGTASLFNNMLRIDPAAAWFNTLMAGCTLLYILLSGRHIRRVALQVGDLYALIFFILVGGYLLASFNTLLMLFLGVEILSIPQYILAGSDRRNLKSSEASLKYFLLGAFSTGIMLMGITLLYGSMGTFVITAMDFSTIQGSSTMAIGGILMMVIALAFKVSAAPFHLWTPDVYDGAPTPFTAYMSTVAKAVALYAFLRLFAGTFHDVSARWLLVLACITAATLLIGNITAVFQQSVKRMLAYSSIAQAGFMLMAVLSINELSTRSLTLYAVAYTLASTGLFAVLMKMKDFTYDGFNGLAKRQPLLAFCAAVFLFSLAGIPLTAGFMAKYYMIMTLIQKGTLLWLVIFALLMAAVSVYYYFRVIAAMYFKDGTPELATPVTGADRVVIGFTAALVILLGVMPGLITG